MRITSTTPRNSQKKSRRRSSIKKLRPHGYRLEGWGELTLRNGLSGTVHFYLSGERHDLPANGRVVGDEQFISNAWIRSWKSKNAGRILLDGGLGLRVHVIGYIEAEHALVIATKSPAGHALEGY